MFKSVESYTITCNTTGKTITGSGVVSVLESSHSTTGNGSQVFGYLNVDGTVMTNISRGTILLFKSKLIIYTTNHSQATVKATVGLFN